jgi:uncharacterized protein (DUF2164 family)
MKPHGFSKEETADLLPRLQTFLREELDLEIGTLQATMLLDFIARDLGHAVYNRGLYDAQALVSGKIEELADVILSLERHPQAR